MKDDSKPAGPAPGMNHADVAVAVQAEKDSKGIQRNTQFLKIDMHTYELEENIAAQHCSLSEPLWWSAPCANPTGPSFLHH